MINISVKLLKVLNNSGIDLFELWDLNRDGRLNKEEFYEFTKATSLTFTDTRTLKAIVDSTFADVDVNGKGYLRYTLKAGAFIISKLG